MSKVATLYHNNRCSKSRAALGLLQERGYQVEIRNYLDQPLSRNELTELISLLKTDVSSLVRSKEPEFKLAKLSKVSTSEEVINAISEYPKLLERPIVVTKLGARIGRPTEVIEEILE